MSSGKKRYTAALKAASKAGSANASDAGLMAQFCEHDMQYAVGALSPMLVWLGAQDAGMTARQLLDMVARRRIDEVEELQWKGMELL